MGNFLRMIAAFVNIIVTIYGHLTNDKLLSITPTIKQAQIKINEIKEHLKVFDKNTVFSPVFYDAYMFMGILRRLEDFVDISDFTKPKVYYDHKTNNKVIIFGSLTAIFKYDHFDSNYSFVGSDVFTVIWEVIPRSTIGISSSFPNLLSDFVIKTKMMTVEKKDSLYSYSKRKDILPIETTEYLDMLFNDIEFELTFAENIKEAMYTNEYSNRKKWKISNYTDFDLVEFNNLRTKADKDPNHHEAEFQEKYVNYRKLKCNVIVDEPSSQNVGRPLIDKW